jgi:hypothetical protein
MISLKIYDPILQYLACNGFTVVDNYASFTNIHGVKSLVVVKYKSGIRTISNILFLNNIVHYHLEERIYCMKHAKNRAEEIVKNKNKNAKTGEYFIKEEIIYTNIIPKEYISGDVLDRYIRGYPLFLHL